MLTQAIQIRRSTILADARHGALSRLPHLVQPSTFRQEDDRVETVASLVRVGASTRVQVGSGGVATATAGIMYLAAAALGGFFSYALFKGGGWIFEKKHPVWGVIFLLATTSNAYQAGNKLANGGTA